MSSAVAAYDATFGADGPPPAYADIELAACILLLGSNTSALPPDPVGPHPRGAGARARR